MVKLGDVFSLATSQSAIDPFAINENLKILRDTGGYTKPPTSISCTSMKISLCVIFPNRKSILSKIGIPCLYLHLEQSQKSLPSLL